MAIQKAKNSSNNFDPQNPYHPNDPNFFQNPEEKIENYRPEPTFNYSRVYPTSGDLPSAASSSGNIAFVIGNNGGQKEVYSNGTNWLPLIQ